MAHDEYLRRNLLVAKAMGARGAALVALERLGEQKRPPKWIVEAFRSIEERVEPLPRELAEWRALAPDAPNYAKPTT